MTITSVGYAGTVGDAQWANMVPRVGSAFYSVDDYASFRVTAAVGPRTIQVATGGAQSYGVYALSDSVQLLELPAVASGTRWDLIVLRRNWATKVTTLAVIQGGSSKVLPPRTVTPGTIVEQPLALVRVSAGSTSIQEITDLRCCVANGGALGWDDLVRSYLDHVGTEIRIGNTAWSRVIDGSGSPIWLSSDQSDTGWVIVTLGPGWTTPTGDPDGYRLEVRAVGPLVQMRGAVLASSSASVNDIGTVAAPFRPNKLTFLGAAHGSSSVDFTGELLVRQSGLISVPVGYYDGSLGAGRSVPMHGSWFRN